MSIRILAVSGSSRRDSLNQKLLDVAVVGARIAGAEVTPIRLADYSLPLYDGDLEAEYGLPDGAHALQALVAKHDAMLIATPEYNGGYTALLKNAIDWISRPCNDGSSGVALLTGKVAALVSASPGQLGGVRSQTGMRAVLDKLGMLVIPESFALSHAHQAFDVEGKLKDENVERLVSGVGAALYRTAARLA
ncbi:NADPH-dependent FMN reductase [Paraburkholderia sp. CNPSo 3281]|uniref:NADPH-dependent FMN reductase n=1 Tax=Paraburkholderia sp. CNPSo 3281 TaxID=2940933 RepID=UPI0020B6EA5B|nr:NAD(P)H-dependent oxidoreductase [Paraburkholderia sp. CNPSo 3281]MCP3721293.1 NAD(P)H-dependent oxidoreductase [Paraburkholderia sp. CNPSo 3281]